MREKKNIDRLFQEKFRDFEVVPEEKVWDNIQAELNKKKKRRVIPFWFRLAGAAAILILGGLLLYKLAFSKSVEGEIVSGDKNPVENASPNPGDASPKSGGQLERLPLEKAQDGVAVEPNAESNPSQGANGVELGGNPSENPSGENPSDKPANVHNKRITNESSGAVATTGADKIKNHQGKATNRTTPRLVDKAANHNGGNAVAESSKTEKTENGEKNVNVQTPANRAGSVAISDRKNPNDSNQSEQKLNSGEPDQTRLANRSAAEEKQGSTGAGSNDLKPIENTGIAQDTEIKKDSTAIATVAPNALEELLNEKENNVTAKEQKVNRWQITSNVAPIYFSSTSNGSPLDSRFEGNKKTYAPSVSYGIGAKYALSKKFFIKSGVNSVSLEYNTSDVIFFQTENARKIQNVTPNIQGSLIQVDNVPAPSVATLGRTIRQFSGDLNQRISYVEVPMEMSYRLIDRKFGIELIGGLSTLILNKNEVSLVSSGMDMTIGEADNLNSLHFSTNVGVGFKYTFARKFEANFEPMFKYQINTFSSDAGNFKPYFFGLYTGISFRF